MWSSQSYDWSKYYLLSSFSLPLLYHHCRSNGSILHNLIVATQRPASGYTLNNVTSPVLYKLIHYFMENPINDTTVLKYPVEDQDVSFIAEVFRRNVEITPFFPYKFLWLNSLVYIHLLPWCSNVCSAHCATFDWHFSCPYSRLRQIVVWLSVTGMDRGPEMNFSSEWEH